jgi:hypothetical protein
MVGVKPESAGVQTVEPSSLHLNIKMDFIKQNYATFLSLGPSGCQIRARLLNVSTLFTFRGECIKPVAMINVFVVVHSPQTIVRYFFTVIAKSLFDLGGLLPCVKPWKCNKRDEFDV